MPVDLPALPLTAEVSPRLLSFGADLQPPLGGPTQRVRRLGSRYAVQIELPSLDAECGAEWFAALIRAEAEGDTVRMSWPQANMNLAALHVQATLAGQLGTGLQVSGITAPIPVGSFFSFNSGGHTYLHSITRPSAAGDGSFTCGPMLRASPPAGGAIEFNNPVIEGFADAGGPNWKHQFKKFTSLTLTITENR